MSRGFFVAGTDTGVGKTVVSGALIAALMDDGLGVCGLKPIETGCARFRDGVLQPVDGAFLKEISGSDEPLEDITPYCFEIPAAPLVASETEKKAIDRLWLLRAYQRVSERYDAVVVEGVGGLMVPIMEDYFMLDLARDLRLPIVLVASAFLGSINHTLLSLDCAVRAGLDIAGVVFNFQRPGTGTVAENTNPSVIARLTDVPVLGVMPYLGAQDAPTLLRAAREHLKMDVLKARLDL